MAGDDDKPNGWRTDEVYRIAASLGELQGIQKLLIDSNRESSRTFNAALGELRAEHRVRQEELLKVIHEHLQDDDKRFDEAQRRFTVYDERLRRSEIKAAVVTACALMLWGLFQVGIDFYHSTTKAPVAVQVPEIKITIDKSGQIELQKDKTEKSK